MLVILTHCIYDASSGCNSSGTEALHHPFALNTEHSLLGPGLNNEPSGVPSKQVLDQTRVAFRSPSHLA